MTAPGPSTLDLVASLLHTFLERSDLPPAVELNCLRSAAELQRAGATVTLLPHGPGGVTLADIAAAINRLPAAVFNTDPVLNAVTELTQAAGALETP
jgi:hypothetical protein